jgi:tRNA(Ile2) C34 agmatinyltransferase TiaS
MEKSEWTMQPVCPHCGDLQTWSIKNRTGFRCDYCEIDITVQSKYMKMYKTGVFRGEQEEG